MLTTGPNSKLVLYETRFVARNQAIGRSSETVNFAFIALQSDQINNWR